MPELEANRRPIASRSAGWAKALAAFLARTSVTPNQISAVSVVFAAVGAGLLAFKPDAIGLIGCAAAVQARLVCNLQRMAVLTAACVVGAAEWLFTGTQYALIAAAVIIAAGSVVTRVTRTLAIVAQLRGS